MSVCAGYGNVSPTDLSGSLRFLDKIGKLPAGRGGPCEWGRALDCGAGIGRVTEGCLLHRFKHADVVEPRAEYVEKAKTLLDRQRVERFDCEALQTFVPEAGRYDCIWVQWVSLYLTDEDFVSFLQRCKTALRPQGVVVLKENVVLDGGFHVDKSDNSIMRADSHYRELFTRAGMNLLLDMRQPNFPKQLYPVLMYCLR
mmetsp:Transcript_13421/g.38688  ORF Transcript_13421/g.38688 Transcript_13421/m.38688 type:complete len:199 (-) Transcript_13421:2423-3019(-)